MPANYVLLEKITVGAAGAASVTFSGIPQTGYTDLVVKWSARNDAGAISRSVYVTFNGSSTSYSDRYLQGDGSSASSGSNSGGGTRLYAGECTAFNATANTFANQELYIPNYTSSNNKSVSVDSVSETNATTIYSTLVASLWSNSAAITSMNLTTTSGLFVQGSTFYLYGVAKLGTTPAIVPYATGGDTIMTDGTYWYHTFLSSGTFTPAKGLSCDVLVVAGGGGSGGYNGAGGAGGLSYQSGRSVSSAATVTIGAGGAGGGNQSTNGTNGSNSVFDTITSNGGGGGGAITNNGNAGGSGGGGANGTNGGASNQGSSGGATGFGFAGGNGLNAPTLGGGGGGAGAVGANAGGGVAGNGGAGVNTYSTWLSATGTGVSGFIAGGGGGGNDNGATGATGGSGGGGAGGRHSTSAGGAGVANTGGGAGGNNVNYFGSPAGGSGLVIVRYAV